MVHMCEDLELNRLEFMILESLHYGECKDAFHGMSITEIIEDNEGVLGTRMTIYRKMKKLLKLGYVSKGAMDNHADTFYLLEKANRLFEGGNE